MLKDDIMNFSLLNVIKYHFIISLLFVIIINSNNYYCYSLLLHRVRWWNEKNGALEFYVLERIHRFSYAYIFYVHILILRMFLVLHNVNYK